MDADIDLINAQAKFNNPKPKIFLHREHIEIPDIYCTLPKLVIYCMAIVGNIMSGSTIVVVR